MGSAEKEILKEAAWLLCFLPHYQQKFQTKAFYKNPTKLLAHKHRHCFRHICTMWFPYRRLCSLCLINSTVFFRGEQNWKKKKKNWKENKENWKVQFVYWETSKLIKYNNMWIPMTNILRALWKLSNLHCVNS